MIRVRYAGDSHIRRIGLNRYRGSSKTEMLFADPKPLSILQ